MQLAYTLLLAALSLLTTVSNNPNVSATLRNQAITAANGAITYAQTVINTPAEVATSTVIETPVLAIVPVITTPISTEPHASTTEEVKQYQINDLSNQILVLNTKYASDIQKIVNDPGVTTEGRIIQQGWFKQQYTADYNVLKSKLDLLELGN